MNYRDEILKIMSNTPEIKEKQETYNSVVVWHPKFKGQQPYVPYLWQKFLNKSKELTVFENHITFKITDVDKLIFPNLNKKYVKLMSHNGRIIEIQ